MHAIVLEMHLKGLENMILPYRYVFHMYKASLSVFYCLIWVFSITRNILSTASTTVIMKELEMLMKHYQDPTKGKHFFCTC